MRDAFGSTFMFRIIIIFIFMYVTFATIIVSFAKTYRLKNKVVDYLEQYQFDYHNAEEHDASFVNSNPIIQVVDDFLDSSTYRFNDNVMQKITGVCENQSSTVTGSKTYWGRITSNGACILPIEYKDNRYYYRVTLYMHISIPVLNYDVLIPVSGETEDFSGDSY